MARSSKPTPKYVFDASSLICIEKNDLWDSIKSSKDQIVISNIVAKEVSEGPEGKRFRSFLEKHPEVVTSFTEEEGIKYLEILAQSGRIHEGEASTVTLAMMRSELMLVCNDTAGRKKAKKHKISLTYWKVFVQRAGYLPEVLQSLPDL